MNMLELFCAVDDFVKTIKTNDVYKISYIKNGASYRGGRPRMSLSEMMTRQISKTSNPIICISGLISVMISQNF
jgi:hypothetical protein